MQELAGAARPFDVSHAERAYGLGEFFVARHVARERTVIALLANGDRVGEILADDLGYDNSLYYVGFGFPVRERWQLESNNYFSTTGIERDKEWRSVLNVLYTSERGWNAVLGVGTGEVDFGGLDDTDRIAVAHAMLTVPVFGFHRAHLVLRREDLPGGDVNVAMVGFTYRLPR